MRKERGFRQGTNDNKGGGVKEGTSDNEEGEGV
jgi:hypothetical protein